MHRARWLALPPILGLVSIGIFYVHSQDLGDPKSTLPPREGECMALYEDILPEDARITASAVDGAILRVQYRSASGPGSVTCDLAQDGTVDFTPTMNRKIDWVWDHPEIKPRLRPLSNQFGIGPD